MAINKKLIHFQTLANFNAQLSAGNILDTSICFIKDANKIWTHGQFYDCNVQILNDGGEGRVVLGHNNQTIYPYTLASQVQAGESDLDTYLNNLADVATSGSYNDLSNKPTIPSAVTESTVSEWGFTKNTGTYTKPSTGIPKTDLASAVQISLGKADTALQEDTIRDRYINKVLVNGIDDAIAADANILIDSDGALCGLPSMAEYCDDFIVTKNTLKTINGNSLLGSGDISISGGTTDLSNVVQYNEDGQAVIQNGTMYDGHAGILYALPSAKALDKDEANYVIATDVDLNKKQNTINDLDDIRSGAAKGANSTQQEILQPTGLSAVVVIDSIFVDGEGSTYALPGAGKTTRTGSDYILASEEYVNSKIGGGTSNGANVQAVDTGDVLDDVTVEYVTRTYFDSVVGDINSILESIIYTVEESVITIVPNTTYEDLANSLINKYGTSYGTMRTPLSINAEDNIYLQGFTQVGDGKVEYLHIDSSAVYLYLSNYTSTYYCVRIELISYYSGQYMYD